jgi:hypothetical protein
MSIDTNLGELTSILDLFPSGYLQQNEGKAALLGKLVHYRALLQLTTDALQNLQQNRLHLFDGLVGENACQIRAIMMADLAKKNLGGFIENQLTSLKKASELIQTKDIENSIPKYMRFCDLIEKHELNLKLPRLLLAATLAYHLCITKIVGETTFRKIQTEGIAVIETTDSDYTDPCKWQFANIPIQANFASKMDSFARKKLAEYSVWYVQELVQQLPKNAEVEELRKFSSNAYKKNDGNGRDCLPCFIFMDILYRYALQGQIPILLKMGIVNPDTLSLEKEDEFFLYYQAKDGQYVHQDNVTEVPPDQPVIVMDGFSMALKKFEKAALRDTLLTSSLADNVLGNDAAHRQYPTDKHSQVTLPITRWEEYRSIARTKGFSRENPDLCYIYHVYADTLGHARSGS